MPAYLMIFLLLQSQNFFQTHLFITFKHLMALIQLPSIIPAYFSRYIRYQYITFMDQANISEYFGCNAINDDISFLEKGHQNTRLIKRQCQECQYYQSDGSLAYDSYDELFENIAYFLIYQEYPKRIVEMIDTNQKYKKSRLIKKKMKSYVVSRCKGDSYHLETYEGKRVPMIRKISVLLKQFHGSNHADQIEMKNKCRWSAYDQYCISRYIYKYVSKNCERCSNNNIQHPPRYESLNLCIVSTIQDHNPLSLIQVDPQKKEIEGLINTVNNNIYRCFFDCRLDKYSQSYQDIIYHIATRQIPIYYEQLPQEERQRKIKMLKHAHNYYKVRKCETNGVQHLWKIKMHIRKRKTEQRVTNFLQIYSKVAMQQQSIMILRLVHGNMHGKHRSLALMLKILRKLSYFYLDLRKLAIQNEQHYIKNNQQYILCHECHQKADEQNPLHYVEDKYAIEKKTDCIGLKMQHYSDGKIFTKSKSLGYSYYDGTGGLTVGHKQLKREIITVEKNDIIFEEEQSDQQSLSRQATYHQKVFKNRDKIKLENDHSTINSSQVNRMNFNTHRVLQKQKSKTQTKIALKEGKQYIDLINQKQGATAKGNQLRNERVQQLVHAFQEKGFPVENCLYFIPNPSAHFKEGIKVIMLCTQSMKLKYFYYGESVIFQRCEGILSTDEQWVCYIFYVHDKEGKETLVGISLIEKEDFNNFCFVLKLFFDLMNGVAPNSLTTSYHKDIKQAIQSLICYSGPKPIINMKNLNHTYLHFEVVKHLTAHLPKAFQSTTRIRKKAKQFLRNLMLIPDPIDYMKALRKLKFWLRSPKKFKQFINVQESCCICLQRPRFQILGPIDNSINYYRQRHEFKKLLYRYVGILCPNIANFFSNFYNFCELQFHVPYRMTPIINVNRHFPEYQSIRKQLKGTAFIQLIEKINLSWQIIVKQKKEGLFIFNPTFLDSEVESEEIEIERNQNLREIKVVYKLSQELWQCQCNYIYYMGLPCEHQIYAIMAFGGSILYYVSQRWKLI